MKLALLMGLLLGGLGAIGLIAWYGAADIAEAVAGAGWGLAWVTLVHVGQLAFCALAWKALVASPKAEFGRLLWLRWIRESIDSLLPVVQIGGEVAAAGMLAPRTGGLAASAAGIIADVTVETVTQLPFTLGGICVLLFVETDGVPWAAVTLSIVLLAGAAAFVVAVQRHGGIRALERGLMALARRIGWFGLHEIGGLDDRLQAIYARPKPLAVAGVAHLAAWMLGAFEVSIGAEALGHPIDFHAAFVIESLGQAVRSAAFAVPGGLGVQEGGYIILCGIFGLEPEMAIALSLIKRVRELALGLPGLLAWQLSTGARILRRGLAPASTSAE